ncbi:TMEM175 family protein [Streptomyces bobili]|uniref:TMEM175 family protein n=1 Tax=Streptomyces bobili TaxID=67280 RepID=UPI0033E2C817
MDPSPPATTRAVRGKEDDYVPIARLFALTDGVAAIALTLLVLEIKLPSGLQGAALDHALDETWAEVGALTLSAVVIALFWRVHHTSMRGAVQVDTGLFWLNVAFLALLSLLPFPTSALQDYADRPLGPALYGGAVGVTALVLYAIAVRVRLRAGERPGTVALPAQALVFLASAGIAQFSPAAAMYSWAAAVPLAALADRLARRPGG